MENEFFKPTLIKFPKPAISSQGRSCSERPPEHQGFSAKSLSACSSAEARRCLDYHTAVKLKALPLGIIKLSGYELLTIAVPKQCDLKTSAALKFASDREVKLLPVDDSVLDAAIFRAYHGDERLLENRLADLRAAEPPASGPYARFKLEFRPETGETAQFLAALIDYAISHNASDVHLVPTATGSWIKLRIDGQLLEHQGAVCSPAIHQQLITRIKVLAQLDISQKQSPQDGAFQIPANSREVHVRVSIMPTIHGEKAVLRLLGCEGLLTLPELGLEQKTLCFLESFTQRSEGAVLFAGPTGSGKTSTMYAVLQTLRAKSLSLVTIEDPVEIRLDGAAQTSINERTGLTYSACLRSALRQDPDVILLGEIRDEESAKIAFQAALTGHLLLSTVHARNVTEIFLRLQSLGIDPLSIAQAVNLLICQRLLPKLCPHCRVVDLANSNLLNYEVFQPVGCRRCDYSGFEGRVLAAEALQVDQGCSQKLAAREVSYQDMISAAGDKNYDSLQHSLGRLLRSGKISMNQYLSLCAWDPEAK